MMTITNTATQLQYYTMVYNLRVMGQATKVVSGDHFPFDPHVDVEGSDPVHPYIITVSTRYTGLGVLTSITRGLSIGTEHLTG